MFKPTGFQTLILVFLVWGSAQLCTNTTNNRYDYRVPVQIGGYDSVCSLFTKRTCCSPKNVLAVEKK